MYIRKRKLFRRVTYQGKANIISSTYTQSQSTRISHHRIGNTAASISSVVMLAAFMGALSYSWRGNERRGEVSRGPPVPIIRDECSVYQDSRPGVCAILTRLLEFCPRFQICRNKHFSEGTDFLPQSIRRKFSQVCFLTYSKFSVVVKNRSLISV